MGKKTKKNKEEAHTAAGKGQFTMTQKQDGPTPKQQSPTKKVHKKVRTKTKRC